jgi:Flp pilus assembly secretin CpaC
MECGVARIASTSAPSTAGKKVGKMRKTGWGRFIALLIATTGVFGPQQLMAGDRQDGVFEDISQHSVLTVPSRANFPLAKRVSIGVSKSLLVQFPFELKDVLVSDPDKLDAVVQTSNRIFLIAKKLGQTNASIPKVSRS